MNRLAIASLLLVALTAAPLAAAEKLWVYLGTYTGAKSKGIYRTELDLGAGTLSAPELVGETENPSFLAIHPSKKFLYAVGEVSNFNGQKSGVVSAFALDPKSGKLTLLNQEACGGAGPCHISLDREGKNALVANYGGGSAAVLPIGADGRLGAMSGFVQHEGQGANPRQAKPHAHSINLDPANRFAFVADLGLDKVLIYRFDAAKGTITPNDPASGVVSPGSGPRHFAFHPNGKHAYVINEMAMTVTAFDYAAAAGKLSPIQTVTTLPEGAKGTNFSTAEVQVHPSGKFLYGSNRGHNSLAIYKIDEAGKLTLSDHCDEGIQTPRNFGIDPTGQYLLVANQDGASVVVFRINQQTGQLTATGSKIEVGRPVCVKFMTPPGA